MAQRSGAPDRAAPRAAAPSRPLKLLMCRPTHYAISYEINPWMSVRRPADRLRALKQWDALHKTLTTRLGAKIWLVPPVKKLPDLVFTANAGLVCGDRFILSRFRYPERQGEEAIVTRFVRDELGMRVVTLHRRYKFEGEGDALWCGETLVMGFRYRSDAPVHTRLAKLLGARVLPVELVDPYFYHLDTCFCPLDGRTVMWYPAAFDRYGQQVIRSLAAETIEVSKADARKFVCNAVIGGHAIVLQSGASQGLLRSLAKKGFEVYPVDLSEFLKAGGSAKCLVLNL